MSGVYQGLLPSAYCLSVLRFPRNFPSPLSLLWLADAQIHHVEGGGGRGEAGDDTHPVLPLFFESVFKLPDLLFQALNPSRELRRCQVLLPIVIGAQRGAASPVRDTGRGQLP